MAKCLVLGANGFIGSHLVDALVEAGHKVRAFDRFSGGNPQFIEHEDIEVVSGDFLNRFDLAKAVEGVDYVFHFISTTTPMTAENDPLIDIDTNIRMSVELFQECVEHKVKKVIFASTGGAIYGDTGNEAPIAEAAIPQPVSPYAIGKLTIEHYLHYFHRKFGLDSLVFRISNPYGDRQSLLAKQGVIPIFLQHIAKNEPITILGDGEMVRDYIYIGDVTRLIVESFEDAKQHLYNLGSGHGVTVNELVEIMEKTVDRPIRREHQPSPATFVKRVVLDGSLFQSEFNTSAEVNLEDGIKKTWDYVRKAVEEA